MIAVLRLGHRISRDKRITTHVALVARTFGADTIYITTKDTTIEENIHAINKRWGGNFTIETGVSPKKIMNSWDGQILHLTMYGMQLQEAIPQIHTDTNILIVVGAEKVPPYVYEQADLNIAVGNQPHSEVAALSLLLDRITKGQWEHIQHPGGALRIIPNPKGKHVQTLEETK